jgi:hypothetical protein
MEEINDAMSGLIPVHIFVNEENFDNLSFDAVERVQGTEGLLKDHSNLVAPNPL